MKKLIPRNTTIPTRKSDIFSTSENNQTLVEIHVLQGEREMASDNKSLGRFKLTGIPPAPRGVPQVQVAFDIDANGILQVTALDKTTGREQSVMIQGASTLSDSEVNQMIREAEQFARTDRERRERVEKRNRAEGLTNEAERQLKEVTLDFGNQFASIHRRRIEGLVQELRQAITRNDERAIDRAYSDLQDAIYELKREVQLQFADEDEDDFFGGIRRAFSGESDRDRFWERSTRRDSYDIGGGRPTRERFSEPERSPARISRRQSPRSAPLENDWDDDDDWF